MKDADRHAGDDKFTLEELKLMFIAGFETDEERLRAQLSPDGIVPSIRRMARKAAEAK